MLTPPSRGFALSVTKHNVELDALAEWIEGCITFDDEVLSLPEIADVLVEENIYRSQDFAKERIADAFQELTRRVRCLGNSCPFLVNGIRVRRTKQWKRVPAYSFCLMLALQVSYRANFTTMFGVDYTQQGILFEKLTAEALAQLGCSTHTTAWSRAATVSISDKVEALATHLGEPSRPDAIARWADDDAKDGGLDVVCHLPFADKWGGRPLYYIQCASGENWKEKRNTPNIALWDKLLDLATRPVRGMSIPFVLLADDFRRAVNFDLLSLFLDRHRIAAPVEGIKVNWVSRPLQAELNQWTESRLAALLTAKAN